MSKRYKAKRRERYYASLSVEDGEIDDVPCWCGEPRPFYADIHETCGGTGTVNCLCGGDFCLCHNHGEVECFGCPDCESDSDDNDDFDYWSDLIREEQSNRLM